MSSEQSVRPGNRVRGWNDPPEFLHTVEGGTEVMAQEAAATGTPNRRTILNQRVAHSFDAIPPPPLQDESSHVKTTESHPPMFVPPPITTTTATEMSAIHHQQAELTTNETAMSIEEIESILNEKVKFCKEKNISVKVCEDISKRIKIFVGNWPRLNETVKVKMSNLAKALEGSQLQAANDFHLRLILDYPSEVSQWMVGIKRLIHELIGLLDATPNDENAESSSDSQMPMIICSIPKTT